MSSQSNEIQQRIRQVRDGLGVDVCSLYLVGDGNKSLYLIASAGLENLVGISLGFDQGLTGKVARTLKPVVARDIQRHPEYFHVDDSGEEEYKSYFGIPLESDVALMGVLVIQTIESRTFFLKEIRELHSAARDLMPLLRSRQVA